MAMIGITIGSLFSVHGAFTAAQQRIGVPGIFAMNRRAGFAGDGNGEIRDS